MEKRTSADAHPPIFRAVVAAAGASFMTTLEMFEANIILLNSERH
jgi:hypothetical protein